MPRYCRFASAALLAAWWCVSLAGTSDARVATACDDVNLKGLSSRTAPGRASVDADLGVEHQETIVGGASEGRTAAGEESQGGTAAGATSKEKKTAKDRAVYAALYVPALWVVAAVGVFFVLCSSTSQKNSPTAPSISSTAAAPSVPSTTTRFGDRGDVPTTENCLVNASTASSEPGGQISQPQCDDLAHSRSGRGAGVAPAVARVVPSTLGPSASLLQVREAGFAPVTTRELSTACCVLGVLPPMAVSLASIFYTFAVGVLPVAGILVPVAIIANLVLPAWINQHYFRVVMRTGPCTRPCSCAKLAVCAFAACFSMSQALQSLSAGLGVVSVVGALFAVLQPLFALHIMAGDRFPNPFIAFQLTSVGSWMICCCNARACTDVATFEKLVAGPVGEASKQPAVAREDTVTPNGVKLPKAPATSKAEAAKKAEAGPKAEAATHAAAVTKAEAGPNAAAVSNADVAPKPDKRKAEATTANVAASHYRNSNASDHSKPSDKAACARLGNDDAEGCGDIGQLCPVGKGRTGFSGLPRAVALAETDSVSVNPAHGYDELVQRVEGVYAKSQRKLVPVAALCLALLWYTSAQRVVIKSWGQNWDRDIESAARRGDFGPLHYHVNHFLLWLPLHTPDFLTWGNVDILATTALLVVSTIFKRLRHYGTVLHALKHPQSPPPKCLGVRHLLISFGGGAMALAAAAAVHRAVCTCHEGFCWCAAGEP